MDHKEQTEESGIGWRYWPDAGTVEGPIYCGYCQSKMDVTRDHCGPTSFAGAMSRSKRKYDEFICPHWKEDWHWQIVALKREMARTASACIEQIIIDEIEELLVTRKATKKVLTGLLF